MTRKETESALELCASGIDPNCMKCPYAGNGCFRKLMRDSLRYIGWLKTEAKHAGGKKPTKTQRK